MKRSLDVEIDEEVEFDSLIQNERLLLGLKQSGYEKPSPIQLKTIPLGRLGIDLIAQAKSGTGKTVVFGVITLEAINTTIRHPQAIIVAPTREIAIQIRDVIRNVGRHLDNFGCHAFIGGVSIQSDCQNLSNNCQVVVGTPGRLLALVEEKKLDTLHIKLLVLDEADKLMSDTFLPQTQYIFDKLGKKGISFQSIAFSATFDQDLLDCLSRFLKSPQLIRLTNGVPTLNEVQQYYLKIESSNEDSISNLNIYKKKFEAVEQILGKAPFYQCMIFVNSLPRSIELSTWLNDMGWKSGHIHSGLTQDKRLTVMEHMRDFKLRILVCSDLIARGIDIDRVNLVINLDFPWEIETYLHRVGRTGRFGTSGIAVNLIGPNDQDFFNKLLAEGIQITPLPDKVSYTEYLKDLSEKEQKSFDAHQSNTITTKPVELNRSTRNNKPLSNAPKKKVARKRNTERPALQPVPLPHTFVGQQQSTSSHYFIPPDLYF